MNLKIADFFIGTCSGALVAGVVAFVSPPIFPMISGMVIGMVLTMPMTIALMPFFGAFEVMIPLGVIGMTVGMVAGILSISIPGNIIIAIGGLIGLTIATIIFFSNKHLTEQ